MSVDSIDHLAQAKDLSLSQYENSEILNVLLESWVQPIQQYEDDLISFMNANGINTGSGEMLDVIGYWFGLERELRLDGEFRSAILTRVLIAEMDDQV